MYFKRRKSTCVRLLLASLAVFGILSSSVTATERGYIWLGTGSPAGMYFYVGSAICKTINENSKIIESAGVKQKLFCTGAPSGGSAFNARQLSIGAFTFALLQSDTQYYSHQELKPNQVKPFKGLRSVLSLYLEPFQLVVAQGAGIEKFSDISGKHINVGNIGSGTRNMMLDLMKAHGLGYEDLSSATELNTKEAADALCDGRLDAFVTASAIPSRLVINASDKCGAVVITLDTSIESDLVQLSPYYSTVSIPRNTYSTLKSDVTTIAVTATLVTSRKVNNAVVHELVRTLVQHPENLQNLGAPKIFSEPDKFTRNGLLAPLHPGALKYFLENGFLNDD